MAFIEYPFEKYHGKCIRVESKKENRLYVEEETEDQEETK